MKRFILPVFCVGLCMFSCSVGEGATFENSSHQMAAGNFNVTDAANEVVFIKAVNDWGVANTAGQIYVHDFNTGFSQVLTGVTATQVVAADINGDGRDEVVFIDGGTSFLRSYNFATSAFSTHSAFAIQDVTVGQIDGDAEIELLTSRTTGNTMEFFNLSTGLFTAPPAGGSAGNNVAANFNGDGLTDFAVRNGANSASGALFTLPNPYTAFASHTGVLNRIATGNLDGAGDATDEILLTNSANTIYVNDNSVTFVPTVVGSSGTDPTVGRPEALAGGRELAYILGTGPGAGIVYQGTSAWNIASSPSMTFTALRQTASNDVSAAVGGNTGMFDLIAADVDNDGLDEIIGRKTTNTGSTLFLFKNGTASLVEQNVFLTQSDTAGSSSFATAGNWSDSLAPHAVGYDVGSGRTLRTTLDVGGQTFAGNSLNVYTGGTLSLHHTGTDTINNLNLDGGTIVQGGNTANTTITLAGSINLLSTSTIDTSGRDLIVTSSVSGAGGLIKNSAGTLTLSGTGITYNGATTVNAGTLALVNTTVFASATTVNGGTLSLQDSVAGTTTTGVPSLLINGSGTVETIRGVTGIANRKIMMGNAITGSGIININNAANTAGTADGGWTTVNGGTGSLNFSGTININSGVFARDNVNADTINGTATVHVAAGAVFGAGRGGNSTIGALNGAGDVSTVWANASAGSITIGNGGGSGTFTGSIRGNGTSAVDGNLDGGVLSVIKTGSGTQTFSGSGKTYTGATTVNGGTLELVDLGSTFVSPITVNASGTLELDSSIPFVTRWNYAQTLSGTGIINKTGTGVFGITGVNTFDGTLNILAGRLHNDAVTGNWTGATADVNISSGAVLDLRANDIYVDSLNGPVGAEIWNSHTAGGGDVLFVGVAGGSGTYSGIIRGPATLVNDTPDAATISLTKQGIGTQTLVGSGITYAGPTTISQGTLVLRDTTAFTSAVNVTASGTLESQRTATGIGARNPILGNGITGSGIININNAANSAGTSDGGWTTVSGGTGSLNFSGTININSGVFSRDNIAANTITGTATVNVVAGAVFGAGRGGNSTIGALNGAGDVSTVWGSASAGSITIGNGDGSGSFSGRIRGNGSSAVDGNLEGGVMSVIKVGTGTQTLTGASTYGGSTAIQNGTIVVAGGNDRLPTTTTVTLGSGANSGRLQLGDGTGASNQALAGLVTAGTGLNNAVVGGNASISTLTLNLPGVTNTYAGRLGGAGANENNLALTANLTGAGVLYLSGANTYDGVTNITGGNGFLVALNNTSLGSTVGGTTVSSGNTLQFDDSRTIVGEAVTINGFGALGGTRGALGAWGGSTTWSGSVTLASNSGIYARETAALNISGAIGETGGARSLSLTGNGTHTFSGAASNTYTGTTIVDTHNLNVAPNLGILVLSKTGGAFAISGPIQVGNSNANQPNVRTTVNDQFAPGVVMSFPNASGNWGRFDLQGTSQTLAGLNAGTALTQGGGIVQNERFGGGGAAANATLTLNGSGTYLYNGLVRDEDDGGTTFKLNLVKTGSGTQTLVGTAITYTGTTTIGSGTLVLQNTTAFASATTVNGGTLSLQDSIAGTTTTGVPSLLINGGGTVETIRSVTGIANRKVMMGNAITGSGIININNAANTAGTADGGWSTVNGGTGSLNFSGIINVNSGVFARDNVNADTINGTATVHVAAGAVFGAGRGGNSTIGGLNGAGDVSTVWGGASAGSITIGNGGGSGLFPGSIRGNGSSAVDGNLEGGVMSVIKTGGGTQTFTGASTYSGTTTVQGGTLEIGAGGSIAGTASVTVGLAAFAGGSDRLLLTNPGTHQLGTGDLIVGSTEVGTVDHNAGIVTVGDTDATLENVRIGVGASGIYNINNGATSTLNVGANATTGRGNLIVGDGNTGALNVGTGATINTGDLLVGNGLSSGTVTMTGGTINVINPSTYTLNAGDPAGTTLVNQSGGTTNVTGGMVLGNGTGAATQNQYNLSGGILDFGDTTGASAHHGAGTTPASTLTINTDASFNLTGTGALQDITTISPNSGTFTQAGGRFFIGQDEPGPGDPANPGNNPGLPDTFARTTTINGGFSLLQGGTVYFDAFGPEATPKNYFDAEPIDLLRVTGAANLNGIFDFDDEYGAKFGDIHTLMLAQSVNLGPNFAIDGGFFRVVPTGLGPGFPQFALQAIVPEPASLAVWSIIGLVGTAFVAARGSRARRIAVCLK